MRRSPYGIELGLDAMPFELVPGGVLQTSSLEDPTMRGHVAKKGNNYYAVVYGAEGGAILEGLRHLILEGIRNDASRVSALAHD